MTALCAVSLVALGLAACKGDTAGAGGPPGGMPPAEVTVVTLKTQDVTLNRELTGRATPSLVAEVRPQVSGIVRQRLFVEGGTVRAGQPLYQLDTTALVADRERAVAQVARAEAALYTARQQAARSAELARGKYISAQDNINAQAAARQAEADLKAARAAAQGAAVPLGFARVTAPISGAIGKSSVTAGALVTAAQAAPLATIQQLDPMFVDLSQSSSEMLQMRREIESGGMAATQDIPVQITLEDGQAYAHTGRLRFAESTVDPSTGSFTIRVSVPNPDRLILPGMSVRARLAIGERRGGLLVPQQAVTRDPKGGANTMVVKTDGTVELREIQVSRTVGDQWLVESGLQPGERVIVEGLQKAQPGGKVKPVERGAAPVKAAAAPAAAAAH